MLENRHGDAIRFLLESRLRYHLRCLREDATDPTMTALERLALVQDRAVRIRGIRQALTTSYENEGTHAR